RAQAVDGVDRVLLPRRDVAQRPHLAVGARRPLGVAAADDVPVGEPLTLFGARRLVRRRQRRRFRVDLDAPLAGHDVELLLVRRGLCGCEGGKAEDQQNRDVPFHEAEPNIGQPSGMFNIVAVLLVLAAAFSYLNHRYLRWPMTIGVMAIALALSLAIIAL